MNPMQNLRRPAALALLLALALAVPAFAAPRHRTTHHRTGAKVTMAQARRTALERVPGGIVKTSALEHEGGKLIYSFDIVEKGKPGRQEVKVDAMTDSVLSVDQESAKEERAEMKKMHSKRAPAAAHDSLRGSH